MFLIRSRLSEGEGHWRSKVEVNTVDQYQGRDKSVIVISFVRSSKDQENLVIFCCFVLLRMHNESMRTLRHMENKIDIRLQFKL